MSIQSNPNPSSIPEEEEDIPTGDIDVVEDIGGPSPNPTDDIPDDSVDDDSILTRDLSGNEFYCITSFMQPDGTLLCAGGCQNDCIYYHKITNNPSNENPNENHIQKILKAHRDSVTCLSFSPSGQYLASGGLDGQVFVWNSADGSLISAPERMPKYGCIIPPTLSENEFLSESKEGVSYPINWLSWHPSPKVPILIAGDSLGRIRIWNPVTGECRKVLWPNELRPSPDNEAHFIDGPVASNEEETACDPEDPEGVFSAFGGWTPTGGEIWSCGREGLKIFEPKSGTARTIPLNLDGSKRRSTDGSYIPFHSEGAIRSAAISRTGAFIATGDEAGIVMVSSNQSGSLRVIAELPTGAEGERMSIERLQFSYDEKFLVGGSLDGSAYVWEKGASWQLRQVLKHTSGVSVVKFSPVHSGGLVAGGHLLVTGCVDGSVRVWDVRDGKCIQCLKGVSGQQEEFMSVTDIDVIQLEAVNALIIAVSSLDGTLQMLSCPEPK